MIFLCIALTLTIAIGSTAQGLYRHTPGGESVGEHVLGIRVVRDARLYDLCPVILIPLALGTGGVAIAVTVGQLGRRDCG
jgi:hypothetical protein